MKRVLGSFGLGVALALGAASGAAASTANLHLTSGGPFVLDGVYVGPYTGTIDGATVQIICDDFADETYLNESWEANVSTYDTLSNVKWDHGNPNQLQLYDEAAWLALQLEKAASQPGVTNSQVGAIQFALWQVFDSAAFGKLSGSDLTNAQAWLTGAQGQTYTPDEFSLNVYTPDGKNITCSGGPCQSVPPQEFLYVTPEPASMILFGAGLAGLLVRRRKHALLCPYKAAASRRTPKALRA